MPFLFIAIGTVMLISAVRGTNDELIALVKSDFTGSNNFLYWIVAIGILGGLGYIGPLRTPSRYMMALVLVVLILKNGGVFQQFTAAINGRAMNAGLTSTGQLLNPAQQAELTPQSQILNQTIQ